MGSVYHPFNQGDLLATVVHTQPYASFTSGTMGWRGNLGESGSLSLYEGVRSRRDVKFGSGVSSGIELYPLDFMDTHSIDKVILVSGSYPATGSINYVKARKAAVPDTLGSAFRLITSENWYQEHFSPIEIMYDYYLGRDQNYFTGSYDYYSLRFKQNSAYVAPAVCFTSASLSTMTSSFTIEAQVKPTIVTGSRDYTIMSQKGRWKLYVTGSTGNLAFSDFASVVTSSSPLNRGTWQHVAFSSDSALGYFYIDGRLVSTAAFTGTLNNTTGSLIVGAEVVLSASNEKYDQGFDGFLFETRAWSPVKTPSQISGSAFSYISNSGSSGLKHYSRFNDGPLSTRHGLIKGSGSFDYSSDHSHGKFENFGLILPVTPLWHKNDDPDFSAPKRAINDEVPMFRVVHVPSMFYGRQIATGSVRLVCNAYSNQGIVRVLKDDGRGALYISGSITTNISGEDYGGVSWNKVGNVFYTEGLIVITDPSLMDFGEIGRDAAVTGTLEVSFKGVSRIPSKVFMCRIGAAEANASNNPTYTSLDTLGDDDPTNDRFVLNGEEPTTYITAVGIYNEEHKLISVAKLAQPIRKREKDKLNIRLRMDF